MFAAYSDRDNVSEHKTLSSTSVGAAIPRGGNISPEAVARAVEKEFEDLDYISEQRLKNITNEDDLSVVKRVDISIDTREHSLSLLGHLTPNLSMLHLKAPSILRSFRDLGTSLRNLRVLRAPRCGITDLDGVSVLPGLKEMYISFNKISDVTPLAMHEMLQVLDMEGNCIQTAQQVDQLSTCDALTTLTLSGNPVTELVEYRRAVVHLVPQVTCLDETNVEECDRVPKISDHVLSLVYKNVSDKKFRSQMANPTASGEEDSSSGASTFAGGDGEHDDAADVTLSLHGDLDVNEMVYRRNFGDCEGSGNTGNPTGGGGAKLRGGRPMAGGHRFVSKSDGFSLMASRPERAWGSRGPSKTAKNGGGGEENDAKSKSASSSSELTHGADVVFAGNAVRALRRRRKEVKAGSQVGTGRGAQRNSRPSTAPNQRSSSRTKNTAREGEGKESESRPKAADDSSVSITATLDRAQELEIEMRDKATSDSRRADILFELRSWRPGEDSGERLESSRMRAAFDHIVRGSADSSTHRKGWSSRPTSSSSEPSAHRNGSRRNENSPRRRQTRQPGDASGVLVQWPKKDRRGKKKEKTSKGKKPSATGKSPTREQGRDKGSSYGDLRSFLGPNSPSNDGEDSSSSEGSPDGHASWARRRSHRQRNAKGPATSPSSSGRSSGLSDHSPSENPTVDIKPGAEDTYDLLTGRTETDDFSGDRQSSDDEVNMRIASLEAMMEGEAGMRHLDSPPPTPRPNVSDIIGMAHREISNKLSSPPGSGHGIDAAGKNGVSGLGRGRKNGKKKDRRSSPRGRNKNDRVEDEEGRRSKYGSSHAGRDDSELISMLKIKPKRVPELRTEEGFQMYFHGISESRMKNLLEEAYQHLKPKERAKKVSRRMALLAGHFG